MGMVGQGDTSCYVSVTWQNPDSEGTDILINTRKSSTRIHRLERFHAELGFFLGAAGEVQPTMMRGVEVVDNGIEQLASVCMDVPQFARAEQFPEFLELVLLVALFLR